MPFSHHSKRFVPLALLAAGGAAAALLMAGCQPVQWVGMQFLYDEAELPPGAQVRRDVAYVSGPRADPEKHRLDLFLPDSAAAEGWPTVVFVHGGGWTEGDKDLRAGYQDVYGNIGRFFAARGIGAAVVNYRLLDLESGNASASDSDADSSAVRWPAQVEDVARAVAFVHRRVVRYGGDPAGLFLMGHSAGAQLAARVALDPAPLARQGLSQEIVAGAIPVSGAALDLTDERTYALSDDPGYYARRFAATGPGWKTKASPVRYVSAGDPPFLILYAGGESEALQRQSRLLAAALDSAGVEQPSGPHHRVAVVPGSSHERIVLALSREEGVAGPAMLRFIRRVHGEGSGAAR